MKPNETVSIWWTIQILEQEKHVLRRKLDAVEGEHESKVSELQSDIAELRKCIEEQHVNLKSGERAKSTIIGQLTEQNQRLTAQLKEVTIIQLTSLVLFHASYCDSSFITK